MSKANNVWVWQGHSDPEILACGHSHRYALLDAVGKGVINPSIRAAVLSQNIPGPKPADDIYWQSVLATPGSQPLAIVWEGNEHNRFLFGHSTPFQLAYGEGRFQVRAGEVFIPVEMVRALFFPTVARLDSMLQSIGPRRQVIVVGTPPPKHERAIRHGIAKEPGYVSSVTKQGLDITTVPISPLSLRLQLWHITQDLLAESAARAGVEYVSVPTSVRDNDGALRDEFSASDATHANEKYGALLWSEIHGRIRRRETSHG